MIETMLFFLGKCFALSNTINLIMLGIISDRLLHRVAFLLALPVMIGLLILAYVYVGPKTTAGVAIVAGILIMKAASETADKKPTNKDKTG